MEERCEWCGVSAYCEAADVDGTAAFPAMLCPDCLAAWLRGENRPVKFPREIGAEEWNAQFADPGEYHDE